MTEMYLEYRTAESRKTEQMKKSWSFRWTYKFLVWTTEPEFLLLSQCLGLCELEIVQFVFYQPLRSCSVFEPQLHSSGDKMTSWLCWRVDGEKTPQSHSFSLNPEQQVKLFTEGDIISSFLYPLDPLGFDQLSLTKDKIIFTWTCEQNQNLTV